MFSIGVLSVRPDRIRFFRLSCVLVLLLSTICLPCPGGDFSILPPGGLLFSGNHQGTWDLYLWQPRENGPPNATEPWSIRALTQTPRPEGNPVFWAPRRLFLCSAPGDNGHFRITALDTAGREVWSCADASGNLGWPQPSPTGNRILAVREDPLTGRLVVDRGTPRD